MVLISSVINLQCHLSHEKQNWKIAIPTKLIQPIIQWYHVVLGHVGIQRLYKTMATHFYAPKLQEAIEVFVKSCDACQRYKLPG